MTKSKRQNAELIESMSCSKSGERYIARTQADQMIGIPEVNLREDCGICALLEHFINQREGMLIANGYRVEGPVVDTNPRGAV